MDRLTILVKEQIIKKYSSVRRFAEDVDIPQTTIASALKKGIGGTSYDTVCKICKLLDIRLADGVYPIIYDDGMQSIIDNYDLLDEFGKHTVTVVFGVELERCRHNAELRDMADKDETNRK